MKKIQVNILRDIPVYVKGKTVSISVDEAGIPSDRFWRRRFLDAKTDHCVEIVNTSKKVGVTKISKHKEQEKPE